LVIEGQFFTPTNVPHSVDVHMSVEDVGLTIGVATVIEEASVITVACSVDSSRLVQSEGVGVGRSAFFHHAVQLIDGNMFASVFDDAGTSGDLPFRKYAGSLDPRLADANEVSVLGFGLWHTDNKGACGPTWAAAWSSLAKMHSTTGPPSFVGSIAGDSIRSEPHLPVDRNPGMGWTRTGFSGLFQ
jgi:hypothetical protein